MSARSLEFVIPGDLQTATGGYGYDRRMIAGLRCLGWQVTVHALDTSFPLPTSAALEHADTVFAGMCEHALVLVDGLALGAMPRVLKAHCMRLELLALIHHPLALEGGVGPEVARALENSERCALQTARHVFVTSDTTKQALSAYGIEPERVSVVEPGSDAAPLARGRRDEALKLLCVAAIIPRKGHDVLVDALAPLAALPWHLTCIGSLTRDPPTVARLRSQLQRLGLEDRVKLVGEVSAAALTGAYLDAGLFVLPSRFEGYGMAVAEALAHGLPVVGTRVGAIEQLVGANAGLLVAPGNVSDLGEALARLLQGPALLASLASGAAIARGMLPRWPQACSRMSDVLERLRDASRNPP